MTQSVWNLAWPSSFCHVYLNEAYCFTPGNILRQDHSRGFWLVCQDKYLQRCDEFGVPYPEGHALFNQKTGDMNYGWWFWRDLNEGRHPALDRNNHVNRVFYHYHTDEMVEERDRKMAEERAIREAAWKAKRDAATPLELRMMNFDWSFEYADQFYPGKNEERDKIFAELEAMTYEQARKSWFIYGPYKDDTSETVYGQPNFQRCPK